jgi:uncharacterized protein (TIGR00297 family)
LVQSTLPVLVSFSSKFSRSTKLSQTYSMTLLTEMEGFARTDLSHRVVLSAVVTLAFAGAARLLRGVSTSGALAGALVCFVVCAGAGFGAFAALVTVFLLASITTRFGYRQKQHLGVAERREGRKASQVLANLGVAAICASLFSLENSHRAWLLALAAALSEAAADTVSSELGQAIGAKPRLITTWKAVPQGTDGGVTVQGTVAGISAAAVVSLVCVSTGMISWKCFGISVAAATAGMLVDSVLGALLEQRRVLNNDGVNFLSTAVAATLAFFFVPTIGC